MFRVSVPSGASTGAYEAVELRDGGRDYLGKGVTKAVQHVNKVIGPALIKKNLPVTAQMEIDNFMTRELDSTENKSKLASMI
ncbi:unnamed protein product [Protopolystoma xenopodis]|uniref:Enolase n=1 Tax=Protopolystoma xenopodis TaxID=117903 RepID=A0A3S5A0H0_9PLAT|nr:unnamed protein product [Protopolystoma xenopodis]